MSEAQWACTPDKSYFVKNAAAYTKGPHLILVQKLTKTVAAQRGPWHAPNVDEGSFLLYFVSLAVHCPPSVKPLGLHKKIQQLLLHWPSAPVALPKLDQYTSATHQRRPLRGWRSEAYTTRHDWAKRSTGCSQLAGASPGSHASSRPALGELWACHASLQQGRRDHHNQNSRPTPPSLATPSCSP